MSATSVSTPAPGDEGPAGSPEKDLVDRAIAFVTRLCGREHEASQALEAARVAHVRRCRSEAALSSAHDEAHAASEKLSALEAHEERRAHSIPFWLGVAVLVILAGADAVPLYWGAESFGQGGSATLVLTGIFLVATVAGMWYVERRAHRRVVIVAFVVAYVLLSLLRAHYLSVVDGASPLAALVEAGGLSAISALLLGFGSSVLARTQRPSHAAARRWVRESARATEVASTRLGQAKHDEAHALAAFRREVERSAFAESPADVDSRAWLAALDSAINELVGRAEGA